MQEFSMLEWLTKASLMVKIIMGILLMLSIISWSIISSKLFHLKSNKIKHYIKTLEFEPNIHALYKDLSTRSKNENEEIVYTAIHAFNTYQHQSIDIRIQNTERSILIKLEAYFSNLYKNLGLLSSIASISPYIGLLGTVIGIMHTFLNLGDASGIQQIAPSIAESLIVTAMGLIVAIPASFAYSYLNEKISTIQSNIYILKDRVINLLTLA